jgi:hypothetical protein
MLVAQEVADFGYGMPVCGGSIPDAGGEDAGYAGNACANAGRAFHDEVGRIHGEADPAASFLAVCDWALFGQPHCRSTVGTGSSKAVAESAEPDQRNLQPAGVMTFGR